MTSLDFNFKAVILISGGGSFLLRFTTASVKDLTRFGIYSDTSVNFRPTVLQTVGERPVSLGLFVQLFVDQCVVCVVKTGNNIAWSIFDQRVPVTGTLLFEVRVLVPVALLNFGCAIKIIRVRTVGAKVGWSDSSINPW